MFAKFYAFEHSANLEIMTKYYNFLSQNLNILLLILLVKLNLKSDQGQGPEKISLYLIFLSLLPHGFCIILLNLYIRIEDMI